MYLRHCMFCILFGILKNFTIPLRIPTNLSLLVGTLSTYFTLVHKTNCKISQLYLKIQQTFDSLVFHQNSLSE